MNAESCRLLVTPRVEPCRGVVAWDPESLVLSAELRGESPAREPRSDLQERIERRMGIRPESYRVVLDEMDFLLDEARRIVSFTIRTNPRSWTTTSLVPLPTDLPQVWGSFDVEYDLNNIALIDVPIVLRWDEAARQLSFSLPANAGRLAWFALADTVAAGLDPDGSLRELRLFRRGDESRPFLEECFGRS